MPVWTGLGGWCRSAAGVLSLAVVACAAGATGCGKEDVRVVVPGTVKIKGQPLTHGRIGIIPAKGNPMSGPIEPDGTFTVTDIPPGEVTITVMEVFGEDGQPQSGAKRAKIPVKYQSKETSDLKFTIGPDTKSIDINLE